MDFYQNLWNQTREKLASNFSETTFEEMFADVKKVIKVENGIIYVLTPSTYIKTKINNIYTKKIAEILASLTNQKLRFKFVCDGEVEIPERKKPAAITKNNLNPNYTFDKFVVGKSNEMAYLSCQEVAKKPGMDIMKNPLYIFGGVGLGKTHMMEAIGNYILEEDSSRRLLYVQATDFMSDYVKAAQSQDMRPFEDKYEGLDVLLVDDIQMLSQANKSQQEFFKLFNEMLNHHKQIVITSDCPATKLNGIMDRLTSRFSQGMCVDIAKPDLTHRVNILKRKLLDNGNKQIDEEVLMLIAKHFQDNVRELEGALNRVLFYSEVYNQQPTLTMATEALDILIKAKSTAQDDYTNALSVICSFYHIEMSDLIGKSRNAKYVLPRHIAMYVLKNHYHLTFTKIGSILNGRDHATIMHGCDNIEEELKTNSELKLAIEAILKKV